MESETKNIRQFRRDVRRLNERDFRINLKEDEEIDFSAADLYDAVMLWAHALSTLRARQGMPASALFKAVGHQGSSRR